MGFIIKLIKIDFILGFLLLALTAWWFLTPSNLSTVESYNQIVGKNYRTRVPVVIFDDEVVSTSEAVALYGPSAHFNILPVSSTLFVKRIQAKPLNGSLQYLSIVTSTGPYYERHVDSADLWPEDHLSDVVSPTNGKIKTRYVEEVPAPINPTSK
jgi:hypothetical protein